MVTQIIIGTFTANFHTTGVNLHYNLGLGHGIERYSRTASERSKLQLKHNVHKRDTH